MPPFHVFVGLLLSGVTNGKYVPSIHIKNKPYPLLPEERDRREGRTSLLQTGAEHYERARKHAHARVHKRAREHQASSKRLEHFWPKFIEDVYTRNGAQKCDSLKEGLKLHRRFETWNGTFLLEHDKMCATTPWYKPNQKYLTSLPTYYITLHGKLEDEWQDKYQALFKNFNIVDGVWGKKREDVEAIITEPYENMMTEELEPKRGVIGNTLSHVKAIKQAWDNGDQVALILESDALPDLAPWWPQSLEELTTLLPRDWQTVQLSWTSVEEHDWMKYYRKGEFFRERPSYGSVAYMISRRGMRRLMSRMYDRKSGKFNVRPMRERCKYFTADDCLLSCSVWDDLRQWLPGKRALFEHVYQAVPPRFTSEVHESAVQEGTKEWVTKSFCDDIHSALLYGEKNCPERLWSYEETRQQSFKEMVMSTVGQAVTHLQSLLW